MQNFPTNIIPESQVTLEITWSLICGTFGTRRKHPYKWGIDIDIGATAFLHRPEVKIYSPFYEMDGPHYSAKTSNTPWCRTF